MTTVDLSGKLKELSGVEANDSIGKFLSPYLAGSPKGDALKFYQWALDLYNDRPIQLDKSDLIVFKSFIKEHEGLPAMIKAQALLAIKDEV